MKAETMQLQQGTAEWHAHRSKSFNASEAAAMLGLSPDKSRAEFLREKATGIVKEVDASTQARFDRGHAIEAYARPIAEAYIDTELFPVVLSAEVDGLPLSASLDGLTMLEDVSWECKTLNEELANAMAQDTIQERYKYQIEQGLMLSGAERCLFTASDGNGTTMHVWYEADPEIRRKLLAGWKQFAEDLANYQHVSIPDELIGAEVESLPALVVQVEGRVVSTNIDGFKAAAAKFLDRLPNAASLETDQDFADADKAVKACEEAEDRLKLVKAQAQAQAVEIDEVFRAMDDIAARIRNARLALNKAVTKRKDDIRAGLVMQANKDLAEHIKKMNASLGGEWMPVVDGGFATAIKGKKTMTGLRDAIDTAMADAKIRANEIANTIHQNLRHLEITYANDSLIAPDFKAICTKAPEDFAALLAMRKRQHDEVIEQQRQIAEAEQRAKASSEDVKPVPNTRTEDAPGAVRREDEGTQVAQTSSPPDNGATVKLGEINARLGFVMTGEFLATLGFHPHSREKNAMLFRETDFRAICAAIVDHVRVIAELGWIQTRLRQPCAKRGNVNSEHPTGTGAMTALARDGRK